MVSACMLRAGLFVHTHFMPQMPSAVNASFAKVTFVPRGGNFAIFATVPFLERRAQVGKCMELLIESWCDGWPLLSALRAVTVNEALHSTQVTSRRPVALASIGGPEQGEAVA